MQVTEMLLDWIMMIVHISLLLLLLICSGINVHSALHDGIVMYENGFLIYQASQQSGSF